MLFIQNINEENAAIQKKNIVFPTNQLVFEKQLQDTQTILQNVKTTIDNINGVIYQQTPEDISQLFSGDYATQINQVLSTLTDSMNVIDEKLKEVNFEYLSQLSAVKTHPDEYFDSQWVDLKSHCTDFTHNLGSIPLHVSVKYRLKETHLDWQAGTIFYNKLPNQTYTSFDTYNVNGGYGAGGGTWPQCIEGNINQIGNKIFLSLPNNDDAGYYYYQFTGHSMLTNDMYEGEAVNNASNYYTKFQVRILQYKRNG